MEATLNNISLVTTFDDIRRCFAVLNDGTAEEEFLKVLLLQEKFVEELTNINENKDRIQKELDKALQSLADYETKLFHARRLLEMEGKARREAEMERDSMEKRIDAIVGILQTERNLRDETKDKLAFLNTLPRKRKSKTRHFDEKCAANEINSTGSFLSDLSITQSEEDFLDGSKDWSKHRPSLSKNQLPLIGNKRARLSQALAGLPMGMHSTPPAPLGRRSAAKYNDLGAGGDNELTQKRSLQTAQGLECISATTKVTIPQDGNGIIRAESTIESVPIAEKQQDNETATPYKKATAPPLSPAKTANINPSQPSQTSRFTMMRQHNFTSKSFIRSDVCAHCRKKIRFGAIGYRCNDCPVRCHTDCRYVLTVSCVPTSGTPTMKGLNMGTISDHAPTVAPMIPALIVHCVNEIETRGLTEVGIYRVSGSEREVKALKERFLRAKAGTPHLGNIDVHVICGCVKDFLRSLREPLIPLNLWSDFANAAQNPNEDEIEKDLYKAIDKLPQANRDTLAFLMLHFQRIGECKNVLMPIENLARVFAPTIVGFSCKDPDQHALLTETYTQYQVMFHLLKMPTAFWSEFVIVALNNNNKDNKENEHCGVARTPSRNKESIYSLYTTPLKSTLKKRKFYGTPPYSTKK